MEVIKDARVVYRPALSWTLKVEGRTADGKKRSEELPVGLDLFGRPVRFRGGATC